MASTPAPFCPQCGAPLQGSSRFCTNCGATIEMNASSPTVAASQAPSAPPAGARPVNPQPRTVLAPTPPNSPSGASLYTNSNESPLAPPPPPTYNPYPQSGPGGPQSYAQTTAPNTYPPQPVIMPPPQSGAYQVPAYAQKPKGNHGCAITSIILLLVLVGAGVGGFFLLRSRGATNGNNSQSTGTTGSSSTVTSTNQGKTPSSSSNAAHTEQLNLQFTYASVTITLISVQSAQSFSDDTSAGPAGIVRINLRENNPTTGNPDYVEGEAMLLLFPGNTTSQESDSQDATSPNAGVNRLNWLDFQLNNPITLNQLVLRVGTQSQTQFDIPLQANADLSKYQDKTSNPGSQFKYGGLSMTLKTATLSYSYADTQASTGNRYVIITLAAVNNTSSSVSTYPGSYMRLQAGGNSVQPEDTYTMPISVSGNTSASGVVGFLVPQDTTSFTLVLLAQPGNTPAINQVTQNFQIQ